jgi:hypothetical protein
MKPPSKKNIKAAIQQLKSKNSVGSGPTANYSQNIPVDSAKKSSQRIRKQGI